MATTHYYSDYPQQESISSNGNYYPYYQDYNSYNNMYYSYQHSASSWDSNYSCGNKIPNQHLNYEQNYVNNYCINNKEMASYQLNFKCNQSIGQIKNQSCEENSTQSRGKLKRNSTSNVDDSPALRALLTNPVKKIRYSPDFYDKMDHSEEKIHQINKSNHLNNDFRKIDYHSSSFNGSKSPYHNNFDQQKVDLKTTILSPNRSENDYLGYSPKMQSHPSKDGFPTPPPPLQIAASTPSTDVCSDRLIDMGSPLSLIEGIGTPPLSPKEHTNNAINQKSDISSQNMTYEWTQNGVISGT